MLKPRRPLFRRLNADRVPGFVEEHPERAVLVWVNKPLAPRELYSSPVRAGDVFNNLASRSAVSAVTPRFPRINSFNRFNEMPIRSAAST
jgi:hypothetical protein